MQNGSMKAVSGSGIASMSEASMLFQPRMLEPSKPKPSAKISSVNSRMGQLKCCQVPKVSTNLMSTILAPLFLANSITFLGVLIDVVPDMLLIGALHKKKGALTFTKFLLHRPAPAGVCPRGDWQFRTKPPPRPSLRSGFESRYRSC